MCVGGEEEEEDLELNHLYPVYISFLFLIFFNDNFFIRKWFIYFTEILLGLEQNKW